MSDKGFFKYFFYISLLLFLLSSEGHSQLADKTKIETKKVFLVKKIVVEGNTILTNKEIRGVVSPFEEKELDLEALRGIADLITQLYQKKHYVLARAFIPPQNIENGVVKIYVIEGKIGKIKIEGNHAYTESFIRYYLDGSIKDGVLQSEKFDKALNLLNEFPNLQVQAFLKQGEALGTTDIIIKVQDKTPIHEQLDYNNFGNRLVGRNRLGLEVWDGNLNKKGDYLDVRAVFPYPSQENPFLQGQYSIPISRTGTKISISYANADVILGQELQVLDIRGAASIYSVSVAQPLVRTGTQTSNVNLSFYYKNVSNFVFTDTLTSHDRLRELALGYDYQWTTISSKSFFDVSVTEGLGRWLGGMSQNDPFSSRVGAGNSFTKFNANYLNVRRILSNDYLFLRGSAQYAFNTLPVTEQYSLGGPDSVRGYPQSELFGDQAWNLGAELRVPLLDASKNTVQAVFFTETGYVSLKNPLIGETPKKHLTGAGFGLRASLGESTSLRLDLGFPLDPSNNSSSEKPILYSQFLTQF